MSISSIFRSDYKKCSFGLPSGNKVKVYVKRELLSPSGEIAGILHLNGTKVYLPKGEILTFGNAGKAEIRIADRSLVGSALLIDALGDNLKLSSVSGRTLKIAVADMLTTDLIPTSEEPIDITRDVSIGFRLSGLNSNLVMRLEIPTSPEVGLHEAMGVSAARPKIDEVPPEKIGVTPSSKAIDCIGLRLTKIIKIFGDPLSFSFSLPDPPRRVRVNKSTGEIYLAYGDRIVKLNRNGQEILSFGNKGNGIGQFNNLIDMAIDEAGNVLVLDGEPNRLQVFDGKGKFLKVVGRGGEKEFFFRRARGMDLDEKGDLYISDEEDGKPCLMVLDSNYNYLKKISFDDGEIKPNSWILVRQGNIYVASMQFGALIENPPYPYSAANIELYSLAEKKSAMFCLKVIVYPIPPHSNAFTKENIANAIDFSTDKAGNIIIMSPWKILILNKGLTCIQEIYGDDISKENDFLIYDIPGTGYTNQNLLGRFQSVAIDRDDCILVCGGRLLFVLDAKGALAVAKPVRETLAEIHRAPSFFGWFFRDNDYMAMSEILGGGIALLSGVFGGLSFIGAIVCGLSFGAICAFILRVKNWFKPKGKDFENMQKRKQVKSLPIIPGTEIVKRK